MRCEGICDDPVIGLRLTVETCLLPALDRPYMSAFVRLSVLFACPRVFQPVLSVLSALLLVLLPSGNVQYELQR